MEYTAKYMRDWVTNNCHLVNVREYDNGLKLLKYKNKVFYKGLWTPELTECRGTVVDQDFNIVMRPPTKVFNLGENDDAYIDPVEDVVWTRKINGFMAHATVWQDRFLVATTGTMDSDFAEMAREHLEPYEQAIRKHVGPGITLTFEIVDERDPHIIEETPGVYLLLARTNTWDAVPSLFTPATICQFADDVGTMAPRYGYSTMCEVKMLSTRMKHEGYMVYGQNKTLKLKTNHYLITKFIGRMRNIKLESMLDNPGKFRTVVDEEYYGLVEQLVANRDQFLGLDSQGRIQFVRQYLLS